MTSCSAFETLKSPSFATVPSFVWLLSFSRVRNHERNLVNLIRTPELRTCTLRHSKGWFANFRSGQFPLCGSDAGRHSPTSCRDVTPGCRARPAASVSRGCRGFRDFSGRSAVRALRPWHIPSRYRHTSACRSTPETCRAQCSSKHLAQVGSFLLAFVDLLKEVAICTLLTKVQMHQASKGCT